MLGFDTTIRWSDFDTGQLGGAAALDRTRDAHLVRVNGVVVAGSTR
jgi:hypothetical protein